MTKIVEWFEGYRNANDRRTSVGLPRLDATSYETGWQDEHTMALYPTAPECRPHPERHPPIGYFWMARGRKDECVSYWNGSCWSNLSTCCYSPIASMTPAEAHASGWRIVKLVDRPSSEMRAEAVKS